MESSKIWQIKLAETATIRSHIIFQQKVNIKVFQVHLSNQWDGKSSPYRKTEQYYRYQYRPYSEEDCIQSEEFLATIKVAHG